MTHIMDFTPGARVPMEYRFQLFPSWFAGTRGPAESAVAEAAESVAKAWHREVADIRVNRTDPERWLVTVEFVQEPRYV